MSEGERMNEPTTVEYTSEELIGAARFCFADPKFYNCFGCPLEHKPCDELEIKLADFVERLETENAALRAQEAREPVPLTGTRKNRSNAEAAALAASAGKE